MKSPALIFVEQIIVNYVGETAQISPRNAINLNFIEKKKTSDFKNPDIQTHGTN